MNRKLQIVIAFILANVAWSSQAQIKGIPSHIVPFDSHSYQEAKPWVVWYFMHASYSKEGIKADLEAMAANNIAGAYFTPIKDKTDPPLFDPPMDTHSLEWWEMFRYLVTEAKRLNIQIAMFPNDGFATAGGPWIKPEQSMQKIVSADTVISISTEAKKVVTVPQPQIIADYYQDLKILAIPVTRNYRRSDTEAVKVSSSYEDDVSRIAVRGNKVHFASSQPGWIQYEFAESFTANSLKIDWTASNYQVNRMKILVSQDGKEFNELIQLQSPRMGWLDWDNGVTHAIPTTTAKYFRFVYDPEGSQPGAEDLDVGKWKPSIKFTGITLFEEARINQFESKTGELWRISPPTEISFVPESSIIQSDKMVDLTKVLKSDGTVELQLPKGKWKILRIGHTSTGHKNETAGAGKGLEADKLSKEAMAFQFEQWYGAAKKSVGPDVSKDVLTVYHIDSWECGSQNWTSTMEEEFRQRRKYPLDLYWPVLAGYVVNSVQESEAFLYDYRSTIADLLNDNGFGTLKQMCDQYGVKFTAEATAPVMSGDGLSHFAWTDHTMGEFWYRSPSHDKPNDVLDAVSGGHIYGKNKVMAEAFTQIRMQWDEHPRLLKSLQDRNYALGVNSLVYHVYTHNPWKDRKPGMTLDGVGTLFQRDQTWWNQGQEWVNYAIRAQQLLQYGKPVRGLAVFVGEEVPRRSILPDRLIHVLPGIIGKDRVEATKKRNKNVGVPMQKVGTVTTTANMYRPEDWVDPLLGYNYDSFSSDVLLKDVQVVDGKVVFSGRVSYEMLVMPSDQTLNYQGDDYTLPTVRKVVNLLEDGATVLFEKLPKMPRGIISSSDSAEFFRLTEGLLQGLSQERIGGSAIASKRVGKGRLLVGSYEESSFANLGISEDLIINNKKNSSISWIHRVAGDLDIYFLANQDSISRQATLSFRSDDRNAFLYNPVTDEMQPLVKLSHDERRTDYQLGFEAYQSYFILFTKEHVDVYELQNFDSQKLKTAWSLDIHGVDYPRISMENPKFWTEQMIPDVKYHSGDGSYVTHFRSRKPKKGERVLLQLSEVECMAEVSLNGNRVGVIWTKPYQIDVTKYLNKGKNTLEINVVNTWGNRFWYESSHPEIAERKVRTTAPSKYLKGFLPAGLQGDVVLQWSRQKSK